MTNTLNKIMHNGTEYDFPEGVPSGGNNGDVLTNVSGTPTWAAPTGGIENVTSGTTTTVTGIWAGSEQEYGDISTPSASVLYFTF